APTIYNQLGELTGYTALPRSFAIAYHQCRWNYNDEDDVKQVNDNFDKFDIPYDVIWLDIEHTDDKKYFTWDTKNFLAPKKMLAELDQAKRKLVTIVDPHIKRDSTYYVYEEFLKADLFVKNRDGLDFSGWCWPGHSLWIDFFNPKAHEAWKSMFTFENYEGSEENLFIWNDMNEPSVFDGPEITMFKDSLHYNGWEHRDLHNLYGMLFHNSTASGVSHRTLKQLRPFVLSRSFYAGSQRVGAIWTGDNTAHWSHLEIATPMLLSNGIAGMAFSGADVGGFFGDPQADLIVRWYQAGAFYPFFRAHAHLDTHRREPWMLGEPYIGLIRNAIRLRYQLLPMWYTAFHDASVCGMPIMRPQFVIFPDDTEGFDIDTQFYVGDSGLLVRPVTAEGATNADVYFADEEVTVIKAFLN
ncbi:Neutral alpha-glucosidase AB, partial [Neolecta irregularis DAH-3]